jgi:hypothetical protein
MVFSYKSSFLPGI